MAICFPRGAVPAHARGGSWRREDGTPLKSGSVFGRRQHIAQSRASSRVVDQYWSNYASFCLVLALRSAAVCSTGRSPSKPTRRRAWRRRPGCEYRPQGLPEQPVGWLGRSESCKQPALLTSASTPEPGTLLRGDGCACPPSQSELQSDLSAPDPATSSRSV